MKFFLNPEEVSSIKDKYIFTDSDFLGILFQDEEALTQILELFSDNYLIVDPLIKFEFLRDVFLPAQRILREEFISNEKVFLPAETHPESLKKIQGNAILLSQIYSHKRTKANPSVADLFLAGRVMNYLENSVLITGNRKDFPACVFRIITVLNYEQKGDGSIRSFPVLGLDKEQFKKCEEDLNKIQRETIKEIEKIPF